MGSTFRKRAAAGIATEYGIRRVASIWFWVVVPSPDIRPTDTPVGGQHGSDILWSFRQAEPIGDRSGSDELPEARVPCRGSTVVEDFRH